MRDYGSRVLSRHTLRQCSKGTLAASPLVAQVTTGRSTISWKEGDAGVRKPKVSPAGNSNPAACNRGMAGHRSRNMHLVISCVFKQDCQMAANPTCGETVSYLREFQPRLAYAEPHLSRILISTYATTRVYAYQGTLQTRASTNHEIRMCATVK